MRTQCNHCHTKFKASDEHKGKIIKCPKCGHPFRISPLIETQTGKTCAECGKTVETLSKDQMVTGRILCSECAGKVWSTPKSPEHDERAVCGPPEHVSNGTAISWQRRIMTTKMYVLLAGIGVTVAVIISLIFVRRNQLSPEE